MSEMNNVVKLGLDIYNGKVQNYSTEDAKEALYKALVEANNGKTSLDIRDMRDGKCNGLFAIVEQIVGSAIGTDLQNDALFNSLVDYRNIELGDKAEFVIESDTLFTVDKASNGNQAVRRQRLIGDKTVKIDTVTAIIKIYEELDRVLAGRVDLNRLIAKVAESFKNDFMLSIYALWNSVVAADIGGTTFFPVAGSYDESTLLTMIEHVEAAAGGKVATIIGTPTACRRLAMSVMSDPAKDSLYNYGIYGKFFGRPVVAVPQRHLPGTTTFAYNENMLTVIAGDNKPIKFVYEGSPLILNRNPGDNMDLTQEYTYIQKYGVGLAVSAGNGGVGIYKVTG